MIPIETLRATHTIVTHANCADGIVSALLCHAALPEARIVFVQYGTSEHRNLRPEPGVGFVDMVPLRGVDPNGAWCLDHHDGQKDIVDAFGALGVYSDKPGVSGVVLAHGEVFCSLVPTHRVDEHFAAESLADLAGIYDTWQQDDPNWRRACQWREAQLFAGYDHLSKFILREVCNRCDQLGALMLDKAMAAARAHAARAVKRTLGGARYAVVSTKATNYLPDLLPDCDVVAGHDYSHDATGPLLSWSLRGVGGFEVLPIAERHPDGGGHPCAAGFSVADDGRSPYARLDELFGAVS